MDGAHFTYAHAPNLRETPTRHVYPSLRAAQRHHGVLSRCGDWRRVGDTSVQVLTLEIHRKQRLPTDTAEERETRLGACPSTVLDSRIHAYTMYTLSTFCFSNAWKNSTSLDMSCADARGTRKQRLLTDTAKDTPRRLSQRCTKISHT